MIRLPLKNLIAEVLTAHAGGEVSINEIQRVHGGDINAAYQLKTDQARYFVKVNSASKYPGMFEQEVIGLRTLAATNTLKTPEVVAYSEEQEESFLLMEWIEQGSPKPKYWEDFGRQLAQLHQTTLNQFGWASDNYIGSLRQHNDWEPTWHEFFVQQRLVPQLKMSLDQGRLSGKHVRQFDRLFQRMEELFPKELPALLHGDLWSGNYLVSADGSPMIMDPAVYYGHREMDLAMTKLFGGFAAEMYRSYEEIFPLENGWEERVDLCNLYPLLVHVNLFGGGYVNQVERILDRFI